MLAFRSLDFSSLGSGMAWGWGLAGNGFGRDYGTRPRPMQIWLATKYEFGCAEQRVRVRVGVTVMVKVIVKVRVKAVLEFVLGTRMGWASG